MKKGAIAGASAALTARAPEDGGKKGRGLTRLGGALRLCAGALALGALLPAAIALGEGEPEYYDHVDVRTTGSITLTVDNVEKVYELTVTGVRVFVGETELSMSGPTRSESRTYPYEFQSARRLSIARGSKIKVICDFQYTVDGKLRKESGEFAFVTSDTTCESDRRKGVDLVITAEDIDEFVSNPRHPGT
ncbi:MAG: hypothetical protein Q4C13_06015, partial [Clostridia bacterium]|nr:hypothetical protein [Clostridia bacterium]